MRKAYLIFHLFCMATLCMIWVNANAIPAIPAQVSGSSMQTQGQVGKPVPPPIQPMSADDYNKAVKSMSDQNQPKASAQPGAATTPAATNGSATPANTAPTQNDNGSGQGNTNGTQAATPTQSVPATFGAPPSANQPKEGPAQAGTYTGFGSGDTNNSGNSSSTTTNQNSGGWSIKY